MIRFRIAPERSQVWVEARSRGQIYTATGTGLTGWLELEVTGAGRINTRVPPKGHAEMGVEKLSARTALYDRELHKRVDSRRYPVISADLFAIARQAGADCYRAEGDISFHGISRPVEDDINVTMATSGTLMLEGDSTFDLRDFGLTPPRVTVLRPRPHTVRPGPQVTVRVRIIALPEVA